MQYVLKLALVMLIGFGCQSKEVKKLHSYERDKLSKTDKILFVVSNQKTYGSSSIKTSNHFGEIVYAYDVLIKAGYEVDFVSPNGGSVTFGYLNKSNSIQRKYLDDAKLLSKLKSTLAPKEVEASSYKALYYVGGGAAMFGVPENKNIQKIAITIYEKNRGVVSAVCHGSAGIVNLKTSNGEYIYKGKNVNGYPDKFERLGAAYYKEFPFSIEQVLIKNGGKFSYSQKNRDQYYQVDGRLVTGQDPSSAKIVAQKIIEILNK
jgi:putative intracellular protease/amidase